MKTFIIFIMLMNMAVAEVLDTKSCRSMYETRFKNKSYKLYSIYESKSLCGFVMNNNTIGFDINGVAEGQAFSSKEKKLLAYKGKWINIFSKDNSSEVIHQNLSEIGITKDFNCISALPIKSHVLCPLRSENAFIIIVKTKNENYVQAANDLN